jgi:hypothetical protein
VTTTGRGFDLADVELLLERLRHPSRGRSAPRGLTGGMPARRAPGTWRKDAQERLATYDQLPTDPDRDERDTDLLGELHFGFPHLTDEVQR